MANQIKGGKKPAPKKRKSVALNPDEIFTNRLNVPADVIADAEKNGWELRFVDATELQKNGGQHKNGWIAYKRKAGSTDDFGFKFGNDPDGVIRRTSMYLAYRPIEQGDKHRAFLKQRAERLSGAFNKQEASRLREEASKSGLEVELLEGFEENQDAE